MHLEVEGVLTGVFVRCFKDAFITFALLNPRHRSGLPVHMSSNSYNIRFSHQTGVFINVLTSAKMSKGFESLQSVQ